MYLLQLILLSSSNDAVYLFLWQPWTTLRSLYQQTTTPYGSLIQWYTIDASIHHCLIPDNRMLLLLPRSWVISELQLFQFIKNAFCQEITNTRIYLLRYTSCTLFNSDQSRKVHKTSLSPIS